MFNLPKPSRSTLPLSETSSITSLPSEQKQGNVELTRQRGNYLLEFAVVLAALTPVVFGAIDINSALQGYNAVRESADTAARCLYPTDAGCTNTSTFNDVGQFYDWYQDANVTKFRPEKSDYAGKAWWATRPTYSWNTYSATAYSSARFAYFNNYQGFHTGVYQSENITFNVQTDNLPYIVQKDLGDNRRVRFYRDSGANLPEVSPETLGASFTFISGAADSAVSGTNLAAKKNIDLIIEANLPDFSAIYYRCFKSNVFNQGTTTPSANLTQSCPDVSLASGQPTIPIGFWLRGYTHGLNDVANASVELKLSYWAPVQGSNPPQYTWSTYQQGALGGQSFAINGSNNAADHQRQDFDPRGFGGRCGGDDCRTEIVYVPIGSRKIRVRIEASNNFQRMNDSASDNVDNISEESSWTLNLSESSFFTPKFLSQTVSASCSNCSLNANSCTRSYGGQYFGPNPGQIPTVSSPSDAFTAPPGQQTTKVLAQNLNTIPHNSPLGSPQQFASLSVASTALGGSSYGCPISVQDVGAPIPATVDVPCPTTHGGALPGRTSNCNPPAPLNAHTQPVQYNSTQVLAPQTPSERAAFAWNFSWTQQTCNSNYSAANFAAPDALKNRYATYTAPTATTSANSTTYADVTEGDGQNPNDASSPYACAAFPKKCELYDVNPSGGASADCPLVAPAPAGLPSSVFNGLQNRYNYSADALRTALRSAAQELGMATHKYLEPVATDVVTSNDDSLYALTCPGSNIVCATKLFTESTTLVASNLPEGTVPAGCTGNTCYTRLSSVSGQGASGVSSDFASAAALGQQEFMAAFSRARFDCAEGSTDKDCAWVSASQVGDEVEVTTKLNVPFYFLGNGTRQMSHTQRRKLERSYVR